MNSKQPDIWQALQAGTVIPAHPLALKGDRSLDEQYQRLLTRYYITSGAGGIAVGVHTTQFEIRRPEVQLLERVLSLAAEEVEQAQLGTPFIKVAGICGATDQACKEAELSVRYGYHLGLLSMGGLASWSEDALLERARTVSEIIPVFGFYLQPAVGGRVLSYEFWKAFAEIPNVRAIKIAAFNRYQTLDVVRAVCHSSRCQEIALYTGNDDNIVVDLLSPYRFVVDGQPVVKRFVGGLLGHWAVWTSKAVALLQQIKESRAKGSFDLEQWLAVNVEITDMNAVLFDVNNSFHGCIPGIHEVLYQQGLLRGTWCLNPQEQLSAGQGREIERIYAAYAQHTDDAFVRCFLEKELAISALASPQSTT